MSSGDVVNGEAVVHLTAQSTTDVYGDVTLTFAPAMTYTAPVWPRTSDEESTPSRSPVVVGLSVALPRETSVSPRDRFEVRGLTWEVDGEPADYRSPFSARGLVVVNLRRAVG